MLLLTLDLKKKKNVFFFLRNQIVCDKNIIFFNKLKIIVFKRETLINICFWKVNI